MVDRVDIDVVIYCSIQEGIAFITVAIFDWRQRQTPNGKKPI